MLTVFAVLAIGAFIMTLISAAQPSKIPLWVPVLLLCIIEALRCLPMGH
jgi:hypothetical protein